MTPQTPSQRLAKLEGKYFRSNATGAIYKIEDGKAFLAIARMRSVYDSTSIMQFVDKDIWTECDPAGKGIEKEK